MDFPISQLRIVDLHFWQDNGNPSSHMMHESQVDKFIKASLELHYLPGVNPRRPDAKVAKVEYIRVNKLDVKGKTYWWCKSNLDANGAVINTLDLGHYAWIHPDSKLLNED